MPLPPPVTTITLSRSCIEVPSAVLTAIGRARSGCRTIASTLTGREPHGPGMSLGAFGSGGVGLVVIGRDVWAGGGGGGCP